MEIEDEKKQKQNQEKEDEEEVETSRNFNDIEKQKQSEKNDILNNEEEENEGDESESEKELHNKQYEEQLKYLKQLEQDKQNTSLQGDNDDEEQEQENDEEEQQDNQQEEKIQVKTVKKQGRQKKLQTKEEQEDQIQFEKERMASIDKKMKLLLSKAEKYADFLINRHKKRKGSLQQENKRRGNWEEEQEEEKELLEDEEETHQATYLSKQPQILKGGQLKSYQLLSLNWMISLYEARLSGILADQMGLGKTIQTISLVGFLRETKKVKGPFLIFGPKSVLGNWFKEFQKWLPQCNVIKLIATKEERGEILDKYISKGNFDVCLTSFEGVKICQSSLKKIKWKYIIIDEAHKIKNEESQLSKIIRSFNTQNKLLLTGTPLQNNLHELWSLLNFILPELFNESDLFDDWFAANQQESNLSAEEIEKKNMEMISQLHKILKPFMLRRTKAEVERTMPPKKEIHLFIGLTATQIDIYKKLLKKQSLTTDSDAQKKQYLNTLMQLRKCCNHPYLFEGVEQEGLPVLGEHLVNTCGKLRVLDKLLEKLKKEKHQVLIFSQMTMLLDILEDYCNLRNYKYCRLDGSTEMSVRDEGIEAFTQPNSEKFIYLLSTRAGGLGLNLMTADTVILYDSDWNPQMDLQAMDRAHRIGQKNQVNVYRFISENTVEEKIVERQTIKLRWDNLVINQGKMSQKQKSLSKNEVKDMIQHGAAKIFKAEEGTYNDEQIDQLLQRGEDQTKKFNQNIANKMGDTEKNEDKMNLGMQQINIYEFMGIDKNKEDEELMDEMLAREFELQNENRSRRDKKSLNYNINQQFMMQMQTQSNTSTKGLAPKQIKIPEHHLFKNREQLQEILQMEEDYRVNNILKEKQEQLKKEQENRRAIPARFPKSSELTSENQLEEKADTSKIEEEKEKPKWYQQLTEEQENLKEELLKTGFSTWLKHEFQAYLQGCERYGRDNLEKIQKHIKTKTLEELEEYGKAFWERIDELSEKDRIVKNIERGENVINQRKTYTQLIKEKCQKYKNPKEEIVFDSDNLYNKSRSKFFTYENDKYLVYLCNVHGYGNWKEIRKAIKQENIFRFDYYFRSRTEQDINKRMQSLVKMLEKEREANKLKSDLLKGKNQQQSGDNQETLKRKKDEKEAKAAIKLMQQVKNQQKIQNDQTIVINLEDDDDDEEEEKQQDNQNNKNKQDQDNKETPQKDNDSEKKSGEDINSNKLKQTNITNFFKNSGSKKRQSEQVLDSEEQQKEKKIKTNQE